MYGNWEQIFAASRPLSKYISYSGEREVNWGLAVVLRSILLYWERLFVFIWSEMIYIRTQKSSWYIFDERCTKGCFIVKLPFTSCHQKSNHSIQP